MPTHHDDIALTAGDDWLIAGTLVDENGAALDLSTVEMVQWVLLGPAGVPVLPPGVAVITIVDPPTDGRVDVSVPSAATKHLPPARYLDAMRVVMSETSRSSVWQGIIGVDANPFDLFDTMPPIAFTVAPEFVGAVAEIGVADFTEFVVLRPPPTNLVAVSESIGSPVIGNATIS